MDATNTLAQLNAGELKGTKRLKISAGLTQFPEAIFSLADSLEILDLTGNALSDLPKDLHRLKKLRILFCSNNQFTHLPEVLGQCENLSMIGFKANQINHIPESAIPTKTLRWFIVTDNALKQVPNALGQCQFLQKLMLAGNQLRDLPASMSNCHALALLRISANQFHALPDWLCQLPNLTWLAYAGNPLSDVQIKSPPQILKIDWTQLRLGKALGQGASGITYQAEWQHDGKTEHVAVKLFTSALTSDGLPSCEMQANLMAGDHPHLVGVKGIIAQHPQGVQGLVMPLLNPNLSILASPPSFETCTRDIYPANATLTNAQATHIANGIQSAMQHLHAQGLLHGDLYAHNILWNDEQVVLSDLGGASFLPMHDKAMTDALIQLDKRAYQILVDELFKLVKNNQSAN